MLNLMYITGNPDIAEIVENTGVQRIFVDLECIGKSERQGGMDTVKSSHTYEDIIKIRQTIKKAELLVRCNPIHEATESYCSSKDEIEKAIEAGADVLMLPYFKKASEVEEFIKIVNGRVKTLPLVETPEAVACIDEILALDGIDEIFVGLNDLSLGYGMKFMFQLLVDGTVEKLCEKFKKKGIPYGFGGIAALGKGLLSSDKIIAEHYRLGSTCAILSRSFCNANKISDIDEIRRLFNKGIKDIRDYEIKCASGQIDFKENTRLIKLSVDETINKLYSKI